MPDYKMAADGIGKVFIGEILALISNFFLISSEIIKIYVLKSDSPLTLTGVSRFIAIIGIVIFILGLVTALMGLVKAGKQDENIRTAVTLIGIVICLSIISGFVTGIFRGPYWASVVIALCDVLFVGAVYFTIKGCGSLLRKGGDVILAESSDTLSIIIVILFVAAIVFYFFQGVFSLMPLLEILLLFAYSITVIVAYFMNLTLLSKTQKRLERL